MAATFRIVFNLDATEEQQLPNMALERMAGFNDENEQIEGITPLLDGIEAYVPEPKISEGPLQMQITSLDYSSFLGRIAA